MSALSSHSFIGRALRLLFTGGLFLASFLYCRVDTTDVQVPYISSRKEDNWYTEYQNQYYIPLHFNPPLSTNACPASNPPQ